MRNPGSIQVDIRCTIHYHSLYYYRCYQGFKIEREPGIGGAVTVKWRASASGQEAWKGVDGSASTNWFSSAEAERHAGQSMRIDLALITND